MGANLSLVLSHPWSICVSHWGLATQLAMSAREPLADAPLKMVYLSQQDSQLLHRACGLSVSLVPLFVCHQDTALAFLGVPWPPLPVLLSKQARAHLPDQSKLSFPQARDRVVQTAASMHLCPECLGRRSCGLAANSVLSPSQLHHPSTALMAWAGSLGWGFRRGTWASLRAWDDAVASVAQQNGILSLVPGVCPQRCPCLLLQRMPGAQAQPCCRA